MFGVVGWFTFFICEVGGSNPGRYFSFFFKEINPQYNFAILFEMQSFEIIRQKISLALETEDIKNKKTNSAKALAIHQQLGIPAQVLRKYPLSSPAGISRAKSAVAEGRDIGISGHPHKLNEADEHTLVRWIDELIQQGETVHIRKVIDLVCSCY